MASFLRKQQQELQLRAAAFRQELKGQLSPFPAASAPARLEQQRPQLPSTLPLVRQGPRAFLEQTHDSPPLAKAFRGEPCVANTTARCKGAASKIGNALLAGLKQSPLLRGPTDTAPCRVDAAPDLYTITVDARAHTYPITARIRLLAHACAHTPAAGVLVEVQRLDGEPLALGGVWGEVCRVLQEHGMFVDTEPAQVPEPIVDEAQHWREVRRVVEQNLALGGGVAERDISEASTAVGGEGETSRDRSDGS